MGYVGLSLSLLISQKFNVVAYDIDDSKIKKITNKISPIDDNLIPSFLKKDNLNLTATSSKEKTYIDADYVIICTPTNFDSVSNNFNTSTIENVINDIFKFNKECYIIIKSTVPVGFTKKIRERHNTEKIFYSPEFLREGSALEDNLYPSRIVVGDISEPAQKFADILATCSLLSEEKIKIFFMNSTEAESVKLFSNTFLAMRIYYFNELDMFSEINKLSSEKIISAICEDERIGNYYNNPSFGYGGYCLPKDTKQLLANYDKIPNQLISATINSNKIRKDFIIKSIINKKPKYIGIYRLVMKNNSDNYRESAIIDIIRFLKREKFELLIYEPILKKDFFEEIKVINNFNEFATNSDLIIANRMSDDLSNFSDKVYTRDIFNRN